MEDPNITMKVYIQLEAEKAHRRYLEDDNVKINVELPSMDILIEPLNSVIDANIDTHSHEFNENFEMSHDMPDKSFTIKDFVIMIK
nr:hypothetical protein [Tanacetum cinerariifolium]